MTAEELKAFRSEKRFSVEEMEADRGNAVRFTHEGVFDRFIEAHLSYQIFGNYIVNFPRKISNL